MVNDELYGCVRRRWLFLHGRKEIERLSLLLIVPIAQASLCEDDQEQSQDDTTERKAQLLNIGSGGCRKQMPVCEGLQVGLCPIDGAMQEDGEEQAAFRVVKHPGKDESQGHGKQNEDGEVQQAPDDTSLLDVCWQVYREMPQAPEEPKHERSHKGTTSLLQTREGKATPACFLPEGTKVEVRGVRCGIQQQRCRGKCAQGVLTPRQGKADQHLDEGYPQDGKGIPPPVRAPLNRAVQQAKHACFPLGQSGH